ncbi:hypothetical protein RB195_015240 [Necator americanus]|uniref:F-box domain-containing protein n=1 Tax=Necator americanus TaxID=51031 RepID=A0ABR1E3M3_NECAM
MSGPLKKRKQTEEWGVTKKERGSQEEDQHVEDGCSKLFPFSLLSLEMQLEVLCYLPSKELLTFRLVCRAMNALIVKNALSLHRLKMKMIIAGKPSRVTKCLMDLPIHSCESVEEILRHAPTRSIPCLALNFVHVSSKLLRRLSAAVTQSRVKIDECHLTFCKISCQQEQFLDFLRLSHARKLVLIAFAVDVHASQTLAKSLILQELEIVVVCADLFSGFELSFLPMVQLSTNSLRTLLLKWLESRGTIFFLFMRMSAPFPSEEAILDGLTFSVVDGRYLLMRPNSIEKAEIRCINGTVYINPACEPDLH